ncbi:MAG: MerR family transcriptional regulator [Proteobacteria bacterium]|nr:MerR family transcriptional regulator [Pseudomonadota bacterium]MBU1449403.1 MerR family transcriptional regulator [Pseudomonadota bacterium]MBU2470545.1 MerR family transcriptional regulator [Pseudomonadota bacterium]MBU2519585.1 MerR family transcriptional regulator [Pseudomonadota bacterium]
MKISELAKRTELPKQTIHYYIRAGLLPKPRKLGSNSADYDESYVDRIRLIKELQNDFFLPLPTIKKIMWENRSASKQAMLKLRTEYFRPVEHYLGTGVVGDEAFLKATSLAARWLPILKEWDLISSNTQDGQNVYSQDDIIVGKVMVSMAKLGIHRGNNFKPEVTMPVLADTFREVAKKLIEDFRRATVDMKPSEREELALRGHEVMGVLFYHLYRKYAREYLQDQPPR